MKRRLAAFLLLMSLLIGISFTVSARDMEYFEEDGVEYCWVRGGSTVKPAKAVSGYSWIAVYKENGKRDTRLGDCEEKAADPNHVCTLFCDQARLEYKWKLVSKEVMLIEALDEEGFVMIGTEFVLLKQKIKTNADGSYALNGEGQLQYESSLVIGKGTVEKDGYARMRLDESKLDPTADFQQLVLGQILTEDQLDTYSPLLNRWYVNLVLNNGEYEVYSVKQAPGVNILDPEELKNSNFGVMEEPDASDEYNYTNHILQTRNYYRVGDLIVDISVNGFDGEIPSLVRTNITINGPDDFSRRIRSSDTLKAVRMGEYTVAYSEPVAVEGYTAEEPVVTVQCPVESDSVELTGDVKAVLLNRDHANAKINITYTYTPEHVHVFDEGVVTYPTCTQEGYTTYTCQDTDCGYSYRDEYAEPFGHAYEAEHHETTCTEDGYTIYTCTHCGDVYQEDGDPATGHNFEHKVTKPACTEKGYTTHTCASCGISYRDEEVEATGHDYKLTDTKKPTCTEDGSLIYACLNCGDQKAEPGEQATGHKYDKGKVTVPTCTEKGYTTYTCQNAGCGYSYNGNEVKATGHKYTSQVIEPTTEREGYTLHTCSVCKDTYTDDHKDKLSDDNDSDDDSGDNGAANAGSATAPAGSTANNAANSSSAASGNASDTLIVKSIDELGNPLSGTMVALYNGQTQLRKWACAYDNVAVLDNLERYVKEGESVSLTLVQTKAPNGYEISGDSFTVQVSRQGGKTAVDVRKNPGTVGSATAGSSVETGKDGKPIVTFCNMKKTTRVEISCQVAVEFDENCQTDESVVAKYQEEQYEFVLKWKDAEGEEQTESVLLSHGETVLMEAGLSFNTEYEITGVDAQGNRITGLSDNAAGTISATQAAEVVAVEANLQYTVRAGEPLELKMIVVDEASGTALEGAVFELRDPDGTKIGTYFSHKDGEVHITDAFHVTGDYLLTQTRGPEGYEPISGAAPVMVSLVCVPDTEAGNQVLIQSMEAVIAHQAVSRGTDGVFRIENVSAATEVIMPGKGVNMGVVWGIIGGTLAVAAGVVAVFVLRRKRKQVSHEE